MSSLERNGSCNGSFRRSSCCADVSDPVAFVAALASLERSGEAVSAAWAGEIPQKPPLWTGPKRVMNRRQAHESKTGAVPERVWCIMPLLDLKVFLEEESILEHCNVYFASGRQRRCCTEPASSQKKRPVLP